MNEKRIPEKMKKTALFCLAAVIILFAAGFVLNAVDLSGSSFSRSQQEECVNGFLSSVSERDEDTALRYVCNSNSLGLSGYDGDFATVYEELFSGLEWEIEDIKQLNSRSSRADVKLRVLSVKSVYEELSSAALKTAEEHYTAPEDLDRLVAEELGRLSGKFDRYYTDTEISFDLVFIDGEWKLVLDESFADAVLRS